MAIVSQLTLLVTRPKGIRSAYYELTPGRTFTPISNDNSTGPLYTSRAIQSVSRAYRRQKPNRLHVIRDRRCYAELLCKRDANTSGNDGPACRG